MARRTAPRRPRAGGPSPAVFYGLVTLLSALFVAATWATLEEPERPAPVAIVPPPASPTSLAPSATSSPASTPSQTPIPPTSTPAVVLVERGPPTQTARPPPTATP